jgi:hypothetical protein
MTAAMRRVTLAAGLVVLAVACGDDAARTGRTTTTPSRDEKTRLEVAADAPGRQSQYLDVGDEGMSLSIDGAAATTGSSETTGPPSR